ncbi:MAG TPA: protein phosphatase 2C domain-containing protein [Candidatus Saccharimonadales bacterium]|nr:protein phosphatase 2C domain-containing protein [Candidatus Saccharimonadales bacterium]
MRTDPAVARSDTGRVREGNEDRWLARRYARTVLLAVADGVGGTSGGEIASSVAVETLASSFAAPRTKESARTALANAVQRANDAVLRRGAELGHPQAASTLVAVAIRGREACVANIGDSRAYLIRRGSSRQITTDHAGGPASSITRFVGDARGVQPDIFVETLQPGDRLVLCSDGLTRNVSDAEIAARASGSDPSRAAEELVALANDRGGQDNVTVLIYPARGTGAARANIGTAILVGLLIVGVAGALTAAVIGTTPGIVPGVAPGPGPSVGPVASPIPSAP